MNRSPLQYAANISFLVPMAALFFFGILKRVNRLFAAYLIFATLMTAVELLMSMYGVPNLFVSNARMIIDPLWILIVFIRLEQSKVVRRLLLCGFALFLLYTAAEAILHSHSQELNIDLAVVSRIILLICSLFVMTAEHADTTSPLHTRSIVWIAGGTLLYSAGTLIVVGAANQLMKLGTPVFMMAWYINWSLVIAMNLMYAKGILCRT